jgi:hypothetical protein
VEEETTRQPWRIRYRVPLTVIPPLIGIAVAVPLWGEHGEAEFFSAATHVLAIGAVGMALTGSFFRLGIHLDAGMAGAYTIINVVSVLIATGLGLGFAFHALATGEPGAGSVAITAGALASGIAAFAVQALFGTPGMSSEDDASV